MNKTEIEEKIRAEIAKTEIIVRDYEDMTRPIAPDAAIGRVSRMDAINDKSVVEASLREAKDKLSKLKYVLVRLDSPEFGICRKCKQPIPLARILIRPESMYCVRCAQ